MGTLLSLPTYQKYQKKLFNLVKIKAVQMELKSMQKKCKSKNIQLQQLLTQ